MIIPPLASNTHKKWLPWVVCFSATLFFFYEFILMNMFNALSFDLMRAFSLNATELGKLSAYYFLANLIFLPICGALLDRFSTRVIILSGLFVCLIGIIGFTLTHSFFLACLFRFISGAGSAVCFPSSIRLVSRWFPIDKMAFLTGLIITLAMTGGMVAQTPLALMAALLGWRETLLLAAFFGLFIFSIIYYFVQDFPAASKHEQHAAQKEVLHLGLIKSWRLAYLNVQNILCALYTALANLPIALLGAIWGSLFLQQTEHFSSMQASLAPFVLFFGTILGSPIVGWYSDRIRKRVVLMLFGAIICLLLTLVMLFLPTSTSLTRVLLLFFALGFFSSTQVLSSPLVAESNSKSLTGTAISVISFFAVAGYAIFQPLFGWLMDYNWHGTLNHQLRIYSVNDYHRALLILPIGFFVALIATLFMKEPKKLSTSEPSSLLRS